VFSVQCSGGFGVGFRSSLRTVMSSFPAMSILTRVRSFVEDAEPSFSDDEVIVENLPDSQPEPLEHDGPLSVELRSEYSIYGPTEHNIYALAAVKASASELPPPRRHALDLVFVLDTSGSMAGAKLEVMKTSLNLALQELDACDRVSIVSFSQRALRETPLIVMTAEGKRRAAAAVLRLFAAGGTNITGGLWLGLRVLQERRRRNSVTSLLLLTDGQDAPSLAALPALVHEADEESCSLYGFGLGEDHDASLMRKLGELARSPYTYLRTPSDMTPCFKGFLAGLFLIVAQKVELRLSVKSGELEAVHTPFKVSRTGGERQVVVQIPDVMAGEEKSVLLQLRLPSSVAGEVELLHALVFYTDARRGRLSQIESQVLRASFSDEEQPDQEPDLEVSVKLIMKDVAGFMREASDSGSSARLKRDLEEQEEKLRRVVGCELKRYATDLGEIRTAVQGLEQPGARAALGEQLLMLQLQRHSTVPP